jgi:hypothetical protein
LDKESAQVFVSRLNDRKDLEVRSKRRKQGQRGKKIAYRIKSDKDQEWASVVPNRIRQKPALSEQANRLHHPISVN